MKFKPRTIAMAACMGAVTIFGGVIHGRLTHRWGIPADLVALGRRLEELPLDMGPWKLQEKQELGNDALAMLSPTGYVNRVYVHRGTGESVNVFVIVGRAGPIANHTPEICYSSRNYSIARQRQVAQLERPDGTQDEFWYLTFEHRMLTGDHLRVYYAWSTGERWSAAENQRLAFSGQPFLYKIQLAGYVPAAYANIEAKDPCRSFLSYFLPALQDALPANPESSSLNH